MEDDNKKEHNLIYDFICRKWYNLLCQWQRFLRKFTTAPYLKASQGEIFNAAQKLLTFSVPTNESFSQFPLEAYT